MTSPSQLIFLPLRSGQPTDVEVPGVKVDDFRVLRVQQPLQALRERVARKGRQHREQLLAGVEGLLHFELEALLREVVQVRQQRRVVVGEEPVPGHAALVVVVVVPDDALDVVQLQRVHERPQLGARDAELLHVVVFLVVRRAHGEGLGRVQVALDFALLAALVDFLVENRFHLRQVLFAAPERLPLLQHGRHRLFASALVGRLHAADARPRLSVRLQVSVAPFAEANAGGVGRVGRGSGRGLCGGALCPALGNEAEGLDDGLVFQVLSLQLLDFVVLEALAVLHVVQLNVLQQRQLHVAQVLQKSRLDATFPSGTS